LTANFGRAEPAVGFVLDLDSLTDVLGRSEPPSIAQAAREAAIVSDGEAASVFVEAQRRRMSGERVRIDLSV
jgi:ATP phosphoribosyltransferase regulatory subunit HisZ